MRTVVIALGLCVAGLGFAAETPGTGADAGKTVIYRDTWGVPHIYAPTEEAGMYAMGWAQAEDRPEELLKNIARGIGESAKFEGEDGFLSDLRARMWRHYDLCKEHADKVNPVVRGQVQAYAKGVNDFYKAHPQDVPAWWGQREVDEYMCMAFGRMFLYNWSIDDAYGDLERAGIQPGFDKTKRASNEFAISKERSAAGAPMLYIDPHLGWFGVSRFWELRIHAGALNGSGFALPGVPYIALGHNENLAWAMTTGGPDTADVYELTLDPNNPMKYKYDNEWRDITTREVTIEIKGGEKKTVPVLDSHYGPIIALRNGKAYAAKTAYADCVQGNEAWYALNFGKDYTAVIAAAKTQMVFPQNVMAADTSGNIYYTRAGRIPDRPNGPDWSRPVDGSKSANEWGDKLVAPEDHLQIVNPPQGYMQNCNISPDCMMVNSPLQPKDWRNYVYTDAGYGPLSGWFNQRGARAVELLSTHDKVTPQDAINFALDLHPAGSEHWVKQLLDADAALGGDYKTNPDYVAGIADIKKWDQTLKTDSTGALKYYYWRKTLWTMFGESTMSEVAERIDQLRKIPRGEKYTEVTLESDEQRGALDAFEMAMRTLKADFGKLEATYGDKFRVGRDDKSWPCAGGGDDETGTITLRNVHYSDEKADKTRWGRSGQTSTQIVVLTKPIQSWTQPPIGQSDRPDSPHYRDQAEKLFSAVQMKPTWWLAKDLAEHVETRTALDGAPKGK